MSTAPRRLRRAFAATILGSSLSLAAAAGSTAHASPSAGWSSVPMAHTGTVNGLSGSSPTDVWAVGYFYDQPQGRYRPLTLHWDGSRSTYLVAPTATRGYNAFNSVVEVGTNDIWAVGYHTPVYYTYLDTPLIEHYDGAKWRVSTGPFKGLGTLMDVAATGPDDVWAVGFRSQNPYGSLIEHWDGTKWTLLDDGHSTDNTQYNSVVVKGPNDVWFGGTAQVGSDSVAYAEHWNGSSFTGFLAQPGAEYDVFNAIADDNAGGLWGAGWQSPGLGYFQMGQRFDGSSWTMLQLPDVGGPNNNLYGAASAGDEVWFVGYGIEQPKPLIEHFDGSAWSVESNPGRAGGVLYTAERIGSQIWVAGDGMIMRSTI